MELRVLHLYPDLMSLYGSYANLAMLTRTLSALGHTVSVEPVALGAEVDFTDAALIFMGAGTERARTAALEDARRYREALFAAFEAGTPLLFVGTALELLGREIVTASGESVPGLCLADFTVTEGKRRIVGDVLGETALYADPVVGYMNKCTTLTGVHTPLLTRCALGFGNESEGDAEGWQEKNGFGSQLTGPLLVKNPAMLQAVAAALLTYKGLSLPKEWPVDPHAAAGYAVTAQELARRCQKADT
ncbi:MAG: hypothetical protein J6K98_00360 [Clostridia bacterium]|nr:hypothetical protein [Clostridia bacterium]